MEFFTIRTSKIQKAVLIDNKLKIGRLSLRPTKIHSMKRIFTLVAFALFAKMAAGQIDIGVTLNSPVNNGPAGPGIPLSFDITVTNTGTVPITTSDTIIYAPTLAGSLLSSGGNPIVFSSIQAIAAGGSANFVHNFTGLNISGAGAQTFEFCGIALVRGSNWSGLTESDTTNNTDCNDIAYDPNGVSIDENFILATLKPVNTSYFSNGTLYIRVANMDVKAAEVSVIDLTGKVVYSQFLETSNFELKNDISLNLSRGIYLVNIRSEKAQYGSRKIIVQ